MKLGFVSAILDGWSFEEMIDTARDLGFSCVEAACWPSGKAERRYAGVSHIDVDGLTDEKAAYILGYCKERGVELSSLAFYPNTMDEDLEKRAANIAHLKKVILASEKLGVGMVTTFVGRATHKTVEENLELFREIWDMDSIGDIATVTVHIKKIREKIEADTANPQYIETIWGVGYRFKV